VMTKIKPTPFEAVIAAIAREGVKLVVGGPADSIKQIVSEKKEVGTSTMKDDAEGLAGEASKSRAGTGVSSLTDADAGKRIEAPKGTTANAKRQQRCQLRSETRPGQNEEPVSPVKEGRNLLETSVSETKIVASLRVSKAEDLKLERKVSLLVAQNIVEDSGIVRAELSNTTRKV
jgi:hypothetical protein